MKKHIIWLIIGLLLLTGAFFLYLNKIPYGVNDEQPDNVIGETTPENGSEGNVTAADLGFMRALYYTSPMMEGDDVAQVQQVLKELGYYTGGVDGLFGPLTDQAVKGYQVDYGVYGAQDAQYGIVDEKTWLSLFD